MDARYDVTNFGFIIYLSAKHELHIDKNTCSTTMLQNTVACFKHKTID